MNFFRYLLFVLGIFIFGDVYGARLMGDKQASVKYIVSSDLGKMIPIQSILQYNVNLSYKNDSTEVYMLGLNLPLNTGISGFGITGEYQWHWLSSALSGWFLSPRFSYTKMRDSEEEVLIYSFGVLGNYRFLVRNGFSACFGFGLSYNTGPSLQDKELKNNQGKKLSNTLPIFRIELGWAF